jgi:hypothetical protein
MATCATSFTQQTKPTERRERTQQPHLWTVTQCGQSSRKLGSNYEPKKEHFPLPEWAAAKWKCDRFYFD